MLEYASTRNEDKGRLYNLQMFHTHLTHCQFKKRNMWQEHKDKVFYEEGILILRTGKPEAQPSNEQCGGRFAINLHQLIKRADSTATVLIVSLIVLQDRVLLRKL